jgi:hypothetical protein
MFVSVRIRAGSSLKRFLCFVLFDVRCFPVLPGVRVSQVRGERMVGIWGNNLQKKSS